MRLGTDWCTNVWVFESEMTRRRYFTKGQDAKVLQHLKASTKRPRPVHKGLVQVVNHLGQSHLMSSAEAAMQLGRSKGGRTAHLRGTRYCWTSEQARKAALKAWKTRWRLSKRLNIRLGRPAKLRARVNRAQLRAYYATTPYLGIWYSPKTGWHQRTSEGDSRLTERTALIRLGHLPPPRKRGFVPVDTGIPIAAQRLRHRP